MSKKLTDLDRQLICIIEEQVRLLRNKKAPDAVIINTLIDLVPDVKCLVNSSDDAYLTLQASVCELPWPAAGGS